MAGENHIQVVSEDDRIYIRVGIGQELYDLGPSPTIAQYRQNPQDLKLVGAAFLKLMEQITGIKVDDE